MKTILQRKRLLYALLLTVLCEQIGIAQQNKATIFWDVSSSMVDRDLDREFYFLESYFKEKTNSQVEVFFFADAIAKKENFTVASGDWSALKSELEQVVYDGATSYDFVVDNSSAERDFLIFTDGLQNFKPSTPTLSGRVFVINASSQFNQANLNLLTLLNNANYVDLRDSKKASKAVSESKFKGRVYNDNIGLAQVTIFVKGDEERIVQTDEEGNYKIDVEPGEVLVYNYGSKQVEYTVGEDRTANLSIEGVGFELNEVTVTAREREEGKLTNTAYGKQNSNKIGYAVQTIGEDEITDINTTVSDAVQGRFSGVSLGSSDDISTAVIRGSSSILGNNYGLIVLDGVPLRRSDSRTGGQVVSTDFVDPDNIKSISVLKGLAATNLYGSLGNNGVILITTKTATASEKTGETVDQALLKNNVFDGKVTVNKKLLTTPYLKELKKGKTIKEAYSIYLEQRLKYTDTPEYYLDVYDFFKNSSKPLANRIVSNILEKDTPEYEELRGLFLKTLDEGDGSLAQSAAEKLLELFPSKTQSHLDYALASGYNGKYQQAVNTLKTLVDPNSERNPKFSEFNKLVTAELRNLVNQHRKDLDLVGLDKKYMNNVNYNARLVFEWNNPDAEFEVQFVNPTKRFFTWEHTNIANRELIREEIKKGFFSSQFEIIGNESKGPWQFNITHRGNRTESNKAPTFIKCRVQSNFGSPNQSEKTYVLRLSEVGEKQLFFKLLVN